jgi:hypothetical protein
MDRIETRLLIARIERLEKQLKEADLELKTASSLEPTIAVVNRYQSTKRFIVTSFLHPLVFDLVNRTSAEGGLLVAHRPLNDAALRDWTAGSKRVTTIVWDYDTCNGDMIATSTIQGFRNFVYGARTADDHRNLRKWVVDGSSITDYPEFALGQRYEDADYIRAPLQGEGARSGWVHTVWHVVICWGVRIGIAVVAIVVILAHLHIIEEPHVLFGVVSVLILLLSEQLRAAKEESDRQIGVLKNKIDEQSTAIKSVVENASLKLYALQDCIKDFDAALPSIQPHEKVVIEHLGLDLTQAWQYFEPLLRKHSNLTYIDYRLLILTDDTAKIAGANEEVMSWSVSVPQTLTMIRKEVEAIIERTGGAGRYSLRYGSIGPVPVVHGFRIVTPMSLCYIAICRWVGLDYQKYG